MAKTRYVWDPVSDNVLQEKDGAAGATQVTYTNEPVPFGPLRSERRGSVTRQYHFDALGSTRVLTDDSQTVTDTFAYDAWGLAIQVDLSAPVTFRYRGLRQYSTYSSVLSAPHFPFSIYLYSLARWATKCQHPSYSFQLNEPLSTDVTTAQSVSRRTDGSNAPAYDLSDVSRCQALFRTGATWMPNRPCAVALLNYFLGQQGGTTCPSVCKSKIEAWISSRLSSTQNFLSKRLFKGCGRFESMSWDEDNLLEGWGAVEDGDLFFAFHNFNFSFIGSAFLSCGPNVECCCACTGGTRLYGHLLDDFDFCSSLPPNAVPPWEENRNRWNLRGWIPSGSSLAWCGCVLEDHFLRQSQLGLPSVGGKPFFVDCSIRVVADFSGRYCE
jgi:hypothetical protein